jgi:hypothetical protein
MNASPACRRALRLIASLAAALAVATAPLSATDLLNRNFQTDAIGSVSAGFSYTVTPLDTAYEPSHIFAQVIDAGGGNRALKFFDVSNTVRLVARADFVADAASEHKQVDFSFTARQEEFTSGSFFFLVAVGSFGADMAGQAHRPIEVRLRQDGFLQTFDGGTTYTSVAAVPGIASGVRFRIVGNAGGLPLEYLGSDGSAQVLEPGQWSLWQGNSLVEFAGKTKFAYRSVATSWSGKFGAVSFVTGALATNTFISYSVTDLVIPATPEPEPPVGPNTAPTLAAILSQTVAKGQPLTLSLNYSDAETPAAITVTATSDNAALLPPSAFIVVGSGTEQSLVITPAAGLTGTAEVTVTVTDIGGLSAQRSFSFTALDRLFHADFNGQALGAQVGGFTSLTPGTNTATAKAEVVAFGDGLGAWLFDNSAGGSTSVDRAGFDQNFVANDSAGLGAFEFGFVAKVNADFSSASSDNIALFAATGSYATNSGTSVRANATAFRAIDLRIRQDGIVLVNDGGTLLASPSAWPGLDSGVAFHVVANNTGAPLDYTGPDGVRRSLAHGRWSVFAEGALVTLGGKSQFGIVSAADFTGRFGRIGFTTGNVNSNAGMSFTLDRISVGLPQTATALEAWRQFWFNSSLNSGDAADLADPDGDGVPNVVEFALGSDPTSSQASLWAVDRDGADLVLVYTLAAESRDLVEVVAEWSDDLALSWSTEGVRDDLVSTSNGIELREARVAATGSRKFLRLRVTLR